MNVFFYTIYEQSKRLLSLHSSSDSLSLLINLCINSTNVSLTLKGVSQ